MNIIRTKTKAHGGITPAEKALMDEHSKLWISRAMRTAPIEPDQIVPAIEGLYAVAGLKKPRVVIVPSPMVMAFAYGASAAIWYGRKNAATRAATDAAIRAATYAATDAATYAATDAATRVATDAATGAATYAATDAATYAATRAATYAATDAATRAATGAATDAATDAATGAATGAATYAATDAATYAATYAATRAATGVATYAATYAATRAATYAATYAATRAATGAATGAATDAATRAATGAATDAATDAATGAATGAATRAATRAATYAATRAATYAATDDPEKQASQAAYDLAGKLALQCAARWDYAYQGGNMWAGYDCYLTACRDILGLELTSHAGYAFWEQAAIHGGFRVMHEEFCMVSDFPEVLRVDDQNRAHCESGPSHRWRDGWSLYHWHGVKIPAEWIEDKASLTAAIALGQENAELRRAACDIIGWDRILFQIGAKVVDEDGDPEIGTLLQGDLPDARGEKFLRVRCGTGRDFAIPVPPQMKTALEAQAWLWGETPATFIRPEIRT